MTAKGTKADIVIQSFVNKTLSNSLLNSLPINIEDVAKAEGLKVIAYSFDDDVSGVLVVEGDSATIGYNQGESKVRKRFTIAHELGHYILHRSEPSMLFMDRQTLFRQNGAPYSVTSQELEKEANNFAANILMPEKLVRKEIKKFESSFYDEDTIKSLAKTFEVSTMAMTFRLINLRIISSDFLDL